MAFELIASHIQEQREEHSEQLRLQRLTRRAAPRDLSATDRLRASAGRRLIALGRALGGTALRSGRSPERTGRRAAA